ncbi:hypothetical protein [Devosia faecipullorum]|uniref:hypothetical protein n=1 Tax=Devosia faecipullorum TaxID=2755039 RepID=UPI001E5F990D|nr:hypothetical protein [Devosia faecipullorum]
MKLARLGMPRTALLRNSKSRRECQRGSRKGPHLSKELPGHHIPPIDMFWRRAPSENEGLFAA